MIYYGIQKRKTKNREWMNDLKKKQNKKKNLLNLKKKRGKKTRDDDDDKMREIKTTTPLIYPFCSYFNNADA